MATKILNTGYYMPTGHLTRRMRSERFRFQKYAPVENFYQQTALNRHRSPIEVV